VAEQVRVALLGATGAIGQAVIAAALDRGDIRLVAIARREVPLPPGARMEVLVADPHAWSDAIAASGASAVVCALGTTWAKAGKDEAAFRAVDHDLVLASATAAKAAGVRQFVLLSSVGAQIGARTLYLRTKGEVEEKIAKLRFERFDIIRPGLLRARRSERRPAERAAQVLAPLADLLLHGSWRKYRSIGVARVAAAILDFVTARPRGRFLHEYDSLIRRRH
jgi:uncharacterized protein YbjT (DUF2867 family)